MRPADRVCEEKPKPRSNAGEQDPVFSAVYPVEARETLNQIISFMEADIVPDRLQMTPCAAGGMGAVSHARHQAGDDRGKCQSARHQQDTAGTTARRTGEFVGDQEAEADTCRRLREADGPADGKIFRKFVEGKLRHTKELLTPLRRFAQSGNQRAGGSRRAVRHFSV